MCEPPPRVLAQSQAPTPKSDSDLPGPVDGFPKQVVSHVSAHRPPWVLARGGPCFFSPGLFVRGGKAISVLLNYVPEEFVKQGPVNEAFRGFLSVVFWGFGRPPEPGSPPQAGLPALSPEAATHRGQGKPPPLPHTGCQAGISWGRTVSMGWVGPPPSHAQRNQ